MNISVVGLGKLGAVLAAVLADRQHRVIGVDVNRDNVSAINQGLAPVSEPGLEELIRSNAERLSAGVDLTTAVRETDITFVVVPTPSVADGTFSLRHVLSAAESIALALRDKSSYHLVVISSTVLPGSTGGEVLPLIERVSGKKCGADFGLCYNPEFIALGTVIRDMSSPDLILIGESDERAGSMLEELYASICPSRPPVVRTNFVNAELAKIALNTFVTTKISFANMLAEVCERTPGADAHTVAAAIGLDSRIGGKYLKGAFGYGGPCFPRDNAAFAKFAETRSVDATLAKATDQINRRQVARVAERIFGLAGEGELIGILGLAYKPNTDVVEESQGVLLAAQLLEAGFRVVAYDPAASENARRILDGRVTYAESMLACAAAVRVLVIATPWNEFQSLRPEHLLRSELSPVVIDWWRILPREVFEQGAEYITCGQGPLEDNYRQATASSDMVLASLRRSES